MWINTAIAQVVDAAHHITATLIQTAGPQVVVLGFQHHARQVFLAAPELRHIQQGLGNAVAARWQGHCQLIDMGKTVPVGADHDMPHRLIVQVGHENRTVWRIAKTGELFRVNPIALAVRQDALHRPLIDPLAHLRLAVGADLKAEVIAPHVGIKALVGDPYTEPRILRVHYSLHNHP